MQGLSEHAGVSPTTIRAAERDPASTRDSTWKVILEALGSRVAFSDTEAEAVAEMLGWSPDAVHRLSGSAASSAETPADRRRTARSRIRAVLEAHDDQAETLADVMEAIGRLLDAVQSGLETPLQVITEAIESASVEQEDAPSGPVRVTLPPERVQGGTVQRFEYYTRDGRRLVPLEEGAADDSSKAKKLPRAQ